MRRPGPGGWPVTARLHTPNTVAGGIPRIWGWTQQIPPEVLNDKCFRSGPWEHWPASQDSLKEDPGTHWLILTEAS